MALSLLASALPGPAAAFGAGTEIEINTEEGGMSYVSECVTDAYGQGEEGNSESTQEMAGSAAGASEASDGAPNADSADGAAVNGETNVNSEDAA